MSNSRYSSTSNGNESASAFDPIGDRQGLGPGVREAGVGDPLGVRHVGVLQLHQLVAGSHLVELALEVDHRNELRVLLPGIHVEVVVGLGHARRGHVAGTDPVPLVATLDRRA